LLDTLYRGRRCIVIPVSDEPIWTRPEPPSRPALTPLSRERIVTAAIALADADGLAAVSVRKVAGALDAGPMRLYGYLSTKEELLDLMVDAVYGELPAPEPGDWQAAMRSHAHGLRDAALRHPWLTDLLGGRPSLGPNMLAHMEASLAALDGLGPIDTMLRVYTAVGAYTIGAIRTEIADQRAETASGMDERQWQRSVGSYLAGVLATGRYPTLSKLVADAGHPSPESVFDAGLDYVLAGVAARLAGPPHAG
jgi:AcrR family transcriptional regulator